MLIFWIIYIGVGLFILMEALVEAWTWPEYTLGIKIAGSILAVVIWPAVFFMN